MASCPTTLLYFNEWEALSHREKKSRVQALLVLDFYIFHEHKEKAY